MDKKKEDKFEIIEKQINRGLKNKYLKAARKRRLSSGPSRKSGLYCLRLPKVECETHIPITIPVSTVRINTSRPNSKKRILLSEPKGEYIGKAKLYIAKGAKITKLIDQTNSSIFKMHRNGEIDLSAEGL